MARKKRNKKVKRIETTKNGIVALASAFLVLKSFSFAIETFYPTTRSADTVICIILTAIFAYFVLFESQKHPSYIAMMSVITISYWLKVFLPQFARIVFLIDMFLPIAIVVYFIIAIKVGVFFKQHKKERNDFRCCIPFLTTLFELLMRSISNAFFFASDGMPFLVIGAIIGSILTIVHIVKGIMKKEKGFIHYGILSLSIFTITAAFCMIILLNINYALDFSKPERDTAVIVDAEEEFKRSYRRHSISHMRYEFIVLMDGEEIDITVSSKQYCEFSVGDSIIVNKYKGALGSHYYVIESIEKMLPK